MKKILLSLLAVATMASCAQDEILGISPDNAIGFNAPFVSNSVRSVNDPSYSKDNLFSDFAVYGFVQGQNQNNVATLMDGITVSKTITNGELSSDWKYEHTQYWIENAKYNFNAIAPKTDGNWNATATSKDGVTLSFTNNASVDLLYAKSTEIKGKSSGNAAVAFDFRHLLSKVKFSFENGYNATGATIKVTGIKITNAHETATVALTADATTWSAHADELTVEFGDATDLESTAETKEDTASAYAYGATLESLNEKLLIPAVDAETTYAYNVEFSVALYVNNTLIDNYPHTATVTFAPEVGHTYDIKAVITAKNIDPTHEQDPIEFTVNDITAWEEGTVDNAVIPEVPTVTPTPGA